METKEKTFTDKIIRIQSNLKAPKDLWNDFSKFKYRSCESILEAVKPLLKEEGLFLTISDEIIQVGDRYYIQAIATVSSGKIGNNGRNETLQVSGLAREPLSKKGMDEAQITGATSSYARKYALNGLFCIDDNKDVDTQSNQTTKPASTIKEPQPLATLPQNATKTSKLATQAPQATVTTPKDTKPSTRQRFVNAKKVLGDEEYYKIISKFGVKSASDLKEASKISEALDAVEKAAEISRAFSDDNV